MDATFLEARDVRSCTLQSPLKFILFTQKLIPLGEKVLVFLAETVPLMFNLTGPPWMVKARQRGPTSARQRHTAGRCRARR